MALRSPRTAHAVFSGRFLHRARNTRKVRVFVWRRRLCAVCIIIGVVPSALRLDLAVFRATGLHLQHFHEDAATSRRRVDGADESDDAGLPPRAGSSSSSSSSRRSSPSSRPASTCPSSARRTPRPRRRTARRTARRRSPRSRPRSRTPSHHSPSHLRPVAALVLGAVTALLRKSSPSISRDASGRRRAGHDYATAAVRIVEMISHKLTSR